MDTERFGKEVGARLRQARRSLGWSQARASVLSQGRWSAPALGSWERGDRQVTVETFAGLAEFYGVDPRQVLAAAERAVMTAAAA